MKPITVVLADDHNLVRTGIKSLLQKIEGIEVVGEAGSGNEALALIESVKPNVILMDITMPGMTGLEAARKARTLSDVRIIMLSMHNSEEYVYQALRAGALGYLLKDAGIDELEMAVKKVAANQTFFSPGVTQHIVADYMQRVGGDISPLDRLTPRQREILQLIAEGHTTKNIAEMLKISFKTAETHRTQLMNQLNIHDAIGLVRYAIRVGLVSN